MLTVKTHGVAEGIWGYIASRKSSIVYSPRFRSTANDLRDPDMTTEFSKLLSSTVLVWSDGIFFLTLHI